MGRLGPPWARGIDGVVVTHPDADHVGGMAAVMARHQVAWALESGAEGNSPEAAAFEAALATRGTARHVAEAGTRLILDEAAGVAAEILWPPAEGAELAARDVDDSTNNRSVVLRVRYGGFEALLTGDIGVPVEEALLAAGAPLGADVLKVGHHGSATSTSAAFLAAVAPSNAAISAGRDNRYGHPDPQVLETLGGVAVWRTDREGSIDFVTDGRSLWVASARPTAP
jgi:competence protein ComEC